MVVRSDHRMEAFATLYGSEEYTDMKLTCKDNKSWRLHRSVMCTQSPVMKAAVSQCWQKNGDLLTVEDTHHSPSSVKHLIDYAYNGDYDLMDDRMGLSEIAPSNYVLLQEHIEVYAAAHFYQLTSMTSVIESKFKELIKKTQYGSGFADVVTALVRDIPQESCLHDVVSQFASSHANDILKDQDLLSRLAVADVLEQFFQTFLPKLELTLDYYQTKSLEAGFEMDAMVQQSIEQDEALQSTREELAEALATIQSVQENSDQALQNAAKEYSRLDSLLAEQGSVLHAALDIACRLERLYMVRFGNLRHTDIEFMDLVRERLAVEQKARLN